MGTRNLVGELYTMKCKESCAEIVLDRAGEQPRKIVFDAPGGIPDVDDLRSVLHALGITQNVLYVHPDTAVSIRAASTSCGVLHVDSPDQRDGQHAMQLLQHVYGFISLCSACFILLKSAMTLPIVLTGLFAVGIVIVGLHNQCKPVAVSTPASTITLSTGAALLWIPWTARAAGYVTQVALAAAMPVCCPVFGTCDQRCICETVPRQWGMSSTLCVLTGCHAAASTVSIGIKVLSGVMCVAAMVAIAKRGVSESKAVLWLVCATLGLVWSEYFASLITARCIQGVS